MSPELLEYLKNKIAKGPCSLEELQHLFLPILEELVELHNQGLVSKELTENIEINNGVFHLIEKQGIAIKHNPDYLLETFKPRFTFDLLENFKSSEIENGQHDPWSDIFQFGLIFSSLAFGIKLYDKETLHLFTNNHEYQSKIKQNVNPILSELILKMTITKRRDRTSDLRDLSLKLQFANELQNNTSNIQEILKSFQNSLYDFSKKSNILYTKNTKHHLKLHQTNPFSFPSNKLLEKLNSSTTMVFNLGEDNEKNSSIYSKLKSLRTQSINDTKNKGFSNLKLAFYNIHWTDLDSPEKTIQESPLFFLPVRFSNSKENKLQLEVINYKLETNPALSHYLYSKFNITLPTSLELSDLTDGDIKDVVQKASTKSNVPIQWKIFQGHAQESKDPFSWEIDQDYVVLGNYNYKKISLAKDYEKIVENRLPSQSVSNLILPADEEMKPLTGVSYTPTDLYTIAPTDPYQENAILQARKGEDFVIQGPPGTGKSQTISNVIADFVARDKKVLFVSSKRAALDAVFNKLKASSIENISSIIYDAQNDKKDFVENLHKEYKERVDSVLNFESINNKRNRLANDINEKIALLSKHFQALSSRVNDSKKIRLKDLYRILIDDLGEVEKINDPNPRYYTWEVYGRNYTFLYNKFQEANLKLPFNSQHFSCLSNNTWQHLSEKDTYEKDLLEINSLGEKCSEYLSEIKPFNSRIENINDIDKLHKELEAFIKLDIKFPAVLIDSNSQENKGFTQAIAIQRKLETKLLELKDANNKWLKRIPKEELKNHLPYFKNHEHESLMLFNASYRDKVLDIYRRIRFPFIPSNSNIINALKNLEEEYQIKEKIEALEKQNIASFGTNDLASISTGIKDAKKIISSSNIPFFYSQLKDKTALENMKSFCANWQIFSERLNYIKFNYNESLFEYLEKIKRLLGDVINPPKIASLISNLPDIFFDKFESPEKLQRAFALQTIEFYEKHTPDLKDKFHKKAIRLSQELRDSLADFNTLNQHFIKAKQSNYFNQKIRLSSLSTSGLSNEEKEKKKTLAKGVKVLEKEFSKSRSLKSIRELNESEAQEIIFDLKPVWLMSPTSVSEILPMQESLFDLILFDEASQIGIEEAIPAMFRAKQCIILGDKMQMPPSTFFKKNIEATELIKHHESILHFAEKNWPSIELLWHYRSKHDDLILFNNTVFYEGKLQTIPNRKSRKNDSSFIEIRSINDAAFTYEKVRENTLGFHYIKEGLFENRRNEKEANYIAELVKHFLLSKKDLNLGIIALSSEQETAITQAIHKVKYFDKNFEELLKDKIKSQEFFEDLFIKNLENIQGEERDLIIVSVGYGFDAYGKFSNNFGPINHQGGERRLNVLFSRAKRNLLLVSSIKHTDIKNSYNQGVNSLKDYLEFAEKYSRSENASTITMGDHKAVSTDIVKDPLILHLKKAIEAKAYYVESNYGNSTFKIPIAIKRKSSSKKFALAILIDDDDFFEKPVHFSYAGKAKILNNFGWKTYILTSKDWYYEKETVLQEIFALLERDDKKKKEKKEKESALLSSVDYQLSIKDLLFTRLETQEEPRKYWQIAGNLSDIVIQYGKLGKKGKTLIKSFENVAEVIVKKRNLIKQKEKKGYRRV